MLSASAEDSFIVPEVPDGARTEFAWWDGFSDEFTEFDLPEEGETVPPLPGGEGNAVNRPEADNTDALLYQTGTSTAFITSTQGIYSFAAPLRFLIHDIPSFETDSVLLQTQSVGSLPDLESASLFYRESADGPLLSAGQPQAGEGFLRDDDKAYAMWEWDLSQESIHDLFIVFDSAGSTLSLRQVQLDTFDTVTDNLGVALRIRSNSNFSTVGRVEHHLVGESGPRASYRPGDQVELTAVVDPVFEHEFVGWLDDLSGDANPVVLTVGESPSVRAVFAPKTYDGWADNQFNPYLTDGPSLSVRSEIGADPDGDGLGNLLEYALGGAPESAADLADIRPRVVHGAGGAPRFTYRRQMEATDLEYQVRISNDLRTWYHNGDGTGLTYTEELPDPVFNGDGTETVSVRPGPDAPGGDAVFFQLAITRQP
ncbi:MAG: hypothetical protein ACLFRP_01020 [Puniceicoccaceae bacterium]